MTTKYGAHDDAKMGCHRSQLSKAELVSTLRVTLPLPRERAASAKGQQRHLLPRGQTPGAVDVGPGAHRYRSLYLLMHLSVKVWHV